jgi:Dolichyl-phosphate-mannose-protein mannosyltransferase
VERDIQLRGKPYRKFFPVILIALLFIALGLPFLSAPGIHVDASAEIACIYPCVPPVLAIDVLGQRLPVMQMPYLGTLKTFLYWPILRFFEVSAFSIRLPVLLFGAGSVVLFYLLLYRVSGSGAAIAGALLLATDASFLLATAFDFGPIALLHLLLLAGILLLLRFERTRSWLLLGLAFFLFGLALWHKALFVWMLGGLGVAGIAVFPRRIWALLTPLRLGAARVALAAGALCLGAAPLIYYNVVSKGGTFRTDEVIADPAPFAQKLLVLRKTLNGSALSGFLSDEVPDRFVRSPSGGLEKASVGINRATGDLRGNWMLYGFLASCCLLPWLWFTRARSAAAFALVYMAVAWGQMLILHNTGTGMHHAILIWPFPHFFIAVAGTQFARRIGRVGSAVLVAVLALMAARNLLMVNEYYAHLSTRGTTAFWTDAIFPLQDYVASLPGRKVVATDWGYGATLCLLSRGTSPQHDISFQLLAPEPDAAAMRTLISDPESVFIEHASGSEMFPGVREKLLGVAKKAGYERKVLRVIHDSNGRERFEVTRFVKALSGQRPAISNQQ